MERMKFLLVFLMAFTVVPAWAQEKPAARSSVPPRFVTVLQTNPRKGELELSNVTVRFVPETRTRAVERDGKVEEEERTTIATVYEESMVGTVVLESAQVFEAGGKKLSGEEVLKRVAVGTVVAVSADGKEVSPAYLGALAKDTLIFVSPQLAMQAAVKAHAAPGALLKPRR